MNIEQYRLVLSKCEFEILASSREKGEKVGVERESKEGKFFLNFFTYIFYILARILSLLNSSLIRVMLNVSLSYFLGKLRDIMVF